MHVCRCTSPVSAQEALELMKHIPRETNNIICMSLIRGIHRSRLVGHGSLWLQVSSDSPNAVILSVL